MRDLKVSKELLSEVLNLKVVSHGLLNKLNNSFDITYMPLEDDPYARSMPININDFFFMCKEWATSKSYQIISGLLNNTVFGKHDEKSYAKINYYTEDKIGNREYKGMYIIANTEIEAVIKACEYALKEINENR